MSKSLYNMSGWIRPVIIMRDPPSLKAASLAGYFTTSIIVIIRGFFS